MALGSTTQNLGQGREHYGWEFNPGPLGTRPHGKARFTHLQVWFSACCPQQSATDAASTSSSTHGILEPPVHFCPPAIPTLNCLSVLLLIVGQSAVRRQFLQLSLALCAKACQRRTVPPGHGLMATRPCGWKQHVPPNHLHPLLHFRATAKLV